MPARRCQDKRNKIQQLIQGLPLLLLTFKIKRVQQTDQPSIQVFSPSFILNLAKKLESNMRGPHFP